MRLADEVFDALVRSNPCAQEETAPPYDNSDADALLARIVGRPGAVGSPAPRAALRRRPVRFTGAVTGAVTAVAVAAAAAVALIVVVVSAPSNVPNGGKPSAPGHPSSRLTAWRVAGDVTPPDWQVQGGTAYGTATDLSCASSGFCVWDGIGGGARTAQGVIMASHNGGRTWKQVYGPSTSGSLTVGFSTCPAPTTCMVITMSSPSSRAITADGYTPPVMTVTTDGGSTWSSYPLPASATGLASLSCTTARDCVMVGGQLRRPFAALTTNGGRTWTSGTLPAGFTPTQVDCPSILHCVGWGVAATRAQLTRIPAYSADGGRTWKLGVLPDGTDVQGGLVFSCPDTLHCLATTSEPAKMAGGAFATVVHGVLVTSDGGESWSNVLAIGLTTAQAPGSLTFLRVACTTATACWASGAANPTSGATSSAYRAVVMQTTDGGRQWRADALPSTLEPGDAVGQLSCRTGSGCVAGVQPVSGGPGTGELVLATSKNLGSETG